MLEQELQRAISFIRAFDRGLEIFQETLQQMEEEELNNRSRSSYTVDSKTIEDVRRLLDFLYHSDIALPSARFEQVERLREELLRVTR